MVGTIIISLCGSLVRGFENWIYHIQFKAELESQNLKNELEVLRSQINPHFLFNTLNNIDHLILKAPQKASNVLIGLSDMLRYMIYETKAEKVSIQKEVKHIEQFIELNKIRMRNPNLVQFQFSQNCSANIAPMIFIPFVENAFKYAVEQKDLPFIDIRINCTNNKLVFSCKNYFNDAAMMNGHTGGVGLENVKRRLSLLYPDKHKLSRTKEDSIYNVDLEFEL